MNKLIMIGFFCIVSSTGYGQKGIFSLIPAKPSQAPDYFCTWNLQGYVGNYKSSITTRQQMVEKNIFGDGPHEHWGAMFSKLHRDLFLVLDDDWETPLN